MNGKLGSFSSSGAIHAGNDLGVEVVGGFAKGSLLTVIRWEGSERITLGGGVKIAEGGIDTLGCVILGASIGRFSGVGVDLGDCVSVGSSVGKCPDVGVGVGDGAAVKMVLSFLWNNSGRHWVVEKVRWDAGLQGHQPVCWLLVWHHRLVKTWGRHNCGGRNLLFLVLVRRRSLGCTICDSGIVS